MISGTNSSSITLPQAFSHPHPPPSSTAVQPSVVPIITQSASTGRSGNEVGAAVDSPVALSASATVVWRQPLTTIQPTLLSNHADKGKEPQIQPTIAKAQQGTLTTVKAAYSTHSLAVVHINNNVDLFPTIFNDFDFGTGESGPSSQPATVADSQTLELSILNSLLDGAESFTPITAPLAVVNDGAARNINGHEEAEKRARTESPILPTVPSPTGTTRPPLKRSKAVAEKEERSKTLSTIVSYVLKLLKRDTSISEREVHRREITEEVIKWSTLKRHQRELRELGYGSVQQLEELEKAISRI